MPIQVHKNKTPTIHVFMNRSNISRFVPRLFEEKKICRLHQARLYIIEYTGFHMGIGWRPQNIVANGDISHHEQILILPKCFQMYSKCIVFWKGFNNR